MLAFKMDDHLYHKLGFDEEIDHDWRVHAEQTMLDSFQRFEIDALWEDITDVQLEHLFDHFEKLVEDHFESSESSESSEEEPKFFIPEERKNFNDASNYCKMHGGELASIRNQAEQDEVTSMITEDMWIGLTRGTNG